MSLPRTAYERNSLK